jgi:Uma2 family endonuclease
MKTLAKWSVQDYHRMIEEGILRDHSVELLAGEIVEMTPETPIHYFTSKRGAKYLEELLVGKAEVRFNGLITLQDSEPEPDIAIVRLPETAYCDRHPAPKDIFWLVEVAYSSLKKDLDIKTAIHAAAMIPEYWVLNLATQKITVLRNPQEGRYLEEQIVESGTIVPLAFADIAVSVERLFPSNQNIAP